jgi:hypothetical protein
MKLHDNSRLGGGLIVFLPEANLLKSHRVIELQGNFVGGANLKKYIAGNRGQPAA